MSVILGINAFHAGASAALVIDGRPAVAIAEERLNRVKYFAGFPKLAIQACLDFAGLKFGDVDHLAVGRDPGANRQQKVKCVLRNLRRLPNILKMRRSSHRLCDLKAILRHECEIDPQQFRFRQAHVEHHLAHLASAYFTSPWEKAAGFSLDGSGDFASCMLGDCEGDQIAIRHRVYLPHSIGSLYSMICQYIGYDKYGDEGKVMGLAPYGNDTYAEIFEDMLSLNKNGYTLNKDYFLRYGENAGLEIDPHGRMVLHRLYSDRLQELFGPPRPRHAELTQRDRDMAFGVQQAFDRGYMHLLNALHEMVPADGVVMAGGCALNSVANGKLFDQTPFRQTWIQPAAGDEGLALGAALYVSNAVLKEGRRHVMEDAYLGNEFSDAAIKAALEEAGMQYAELDRESLLNETADEIVKGNVVGWFQGRMEWGPRALGNRSILVHPGLPNMKEVLNARIKHREPFRPFAPVVLAECQTEIFEHGHPSPFMMHVYKIKPAWRQRLCAVNHVDDTGRLQTVTRQQNPLYYDLIEKFFQRTGIPVLLNTSFNENEPIVCRPSEAIDCFARTKMDRLVIGPFVCSKAGRRRDRGSLPHSAARRSSRAQQRL